MTARTARARHKSAAQANRTRDVKRRAQRAARKRQRARAHKAAMRKAAAKMPPG
jgi:hypothetical protein